MSDPPQEETVPLDKVFQDPNPTAVASPLPPAQGPPDACLVHIHPKGPTFGHRYPLGPQPVAIGRGGDCAIVDPDASVSRAHARVELLPDGRYQVSDLGSTNGTYVNNVRTRCEVLADGDYLRVGNSIYRFLAGGNVEAEYHEEIHRLAVTDPLTGLFNRRSMTEFLERELERATRHGRPVAVVLFDIDHFKAINDRFGHVAGDLTLRAVAARVRDLVRRDEVLARYGGEEFAVVLPEADAGQAARCGERLRRAVEAQPFQFEGATFPVTISVGVGVRAAGERVGVTELIDRADRNLYLAKQTGRNRVCS